MNDIHSIFRGRVLSNLNTDVESINGKHITYSLLNYTGFFCNEHEMSYENYYFNNYVMIDVIFRKS